MVELKADAELALMRAAGRVVAEALAAVREHVQAACTVGFSDRRSEPHLARDRVDLDVPVCAVAGGEVGHRLPGQLWDITTHAHLANLGSAAVAMAFSPDGHTLATVDSAGNIQLWNISGRTLIATIAGERVFTNPNTLPIGLAFSPDGRALISLGDSGVNAAQRILDPRRVAELECAVLRLPQFAPVLWSKYIPDQPYEPVCRE